MDYEKYTVNLSGKKYMTVAGRLKMFWDRNPEGEIYTEILEYTKKTDEQGIERVKGVIVKATVVETFRENGTTQGKRRATGLALELFQDKDTLEKAETSAVGRALAFLGYGVDGSIASAEDMQEFLGATNG